MSQRAGFTLLEIMITTLILSLAIAAAGTALDQGERLNERIQLENELNDKVNRVLNDLAMELRTANADPSVLKVGANTVSPLPSGYATGCKIYEYQVSNGIKGFMNGGIQCFGGSMETTYHRVVYDPTAGTLTKELWDSTKTTKQWSVLLADQLTPVSTTRPRGGFYIDQIGNTLAMELAVQQSWRAGAAGETIIKVADSQVLFLRSTLDTNLGSAAYTKSDNPCTGDSVTTTEANILFGHLITYTATGNTGEISIFMQPPIGQTLDASTVVVSVSCSTTNASGTVTTTSANMVEDTAVSVSPYVSGMVMDTRPDKNGNITITLTGTVTGALAVSASCSTKAGVPNTVTKNF